MKYVGHKKVTEEGHATAALIKKLRELSGKTQAEFADLLGVTQPMVSAWQSGRGRIPLGKWLKLGNLAPYPENVECWERAGVDGAAMRRAFEKLSREMSVAPPEGEVVHVPRIRETLAGRQTAGPPVPLATEFLPNPMSTVCMVRDEKATAFVDCPYGVFIVDESEKGAASLSRLWGRVVLASFSAEAGAPLRDSGIYAGRLTFVATSTKNLILAARLWPLSSNNFQEVHWLGRWVNPEAPPLEHALREDNTQFDPREKPAVKAAWKESVERARAEFRLDAGWAILGRVFGRIHIEGAQNDPWSLRL